ncbi:hypothetical protein NHX12_030904 [Muraenolepis orangiensis]|uniref:Uncharacterized protein n=1 Tax=Muraenolepis orangiensis TaxID=630683 RepID=A0A9Q0INB4_9TELE|nr:hypothetical protein NHX12_030904 [Muraenolepis orangiensis]
MASASVVGQNQAAQHRLDSEPQILFFKFVNVRKRMPRKSSLEKMMFGKGSPGTVTGETNGSVTPAGGRGSAASLKPSIHRSDSTVGSPSEGCAALLADAPRCADGDTGGDAQRTDCDSSAPAETRTTTTPVSRERQRGDRNQNIRDCDLNHNTSSQSQKGTKPPRRNRRTGAANVMPGALVANGHTGAGGGAHTDVPHGKRASPGSNVSMGGSSPDGEAGGRLPLERVTQGRTGVVRLARTEPPRREAWSIFSPEGQGDPRVKAERGEGHRFNARTVTQDWCDVCNCQITARAALKCQSEYR